MGAAHRLIRHFLLQSSIRDVEQESEVMCTGERYVA